MFSANALPKIQGKAQVRLKSAPLTIGFDPKAIRSWRKDNIRSSCKVNPCNTNNNKHGQTNREPGSACTAFGQVSCQVT
jgi:hypothetical protein